MLTPQEAWRTFEQVFSQAGLNQRYVSVVVIIQIYPRDEVWKMEDDGPCTSQSYNINLLAKQCSDIAPGKSGAIATYFLESTRP